MFRAIRSARRFVHLEYYVFEDVHCCGESLFELLIAQCRRGVQIAIIFDAVGSSSTPSGSFAKLLRHGIRLLPFNPVNPFKLRSPYSLNRRDHRKILIADGRLAIVGGINMSRAYESPLRSQRRWRDTDLQVQGPAVAQLQRLFLDHWHSQGGVALQEREFYPPLTHQGQERVAIIGGCPGNGGTRFYDVLLAALRGARSRVWMTAGYFLPTAPLMHELAQAAGRGADVRLLLPSHNDSVAALAVQRSTYSRLLAAGVQILERNSVILHSKSAVIDKAWCCVGTSNIDARSVRYNDEVDAIVLGTKTAQSLTLQFLSDVSKARQIESTAWKSRPVLQKLSETMWRPWQGLL
ncbi:MAG TPA: phospholipase D-like domain-containing protein [Steroidobacteraceae bacterium]|nr:phospholipase D-like domain-containing protein [Steroidobacteraceae bacterium]